MLNQMARQLLTSTGILCERLTRKALSLHLRAFTLHAAPTPNAAAAAAEEEEEEDEEEEEEEEEDEEPSPSFCSSSSSSVISSPISSFVISRIYEVVFGVARWHRVVKNGARG